MPSSATQDNSSSNASSSDQKAAKVTQKSNTEGTSTKSRKNGKTKDNGVGGIMAAVRKEAKMNNLNKTPEQSPPNKSPEKLPELPPEETGPALPLPIDSVTVDTLSPTNFLPHPTTTTIDLKDGISYSSSPNNLISFGESPPTQPSSYEERGPNFNAETRTQRGLPNGSHAHSASPSARDRQRPLSYTPLGGHNFSPYESRTKMSPPANRRASMYSPPNRYSPHPPPPHRPQAHFYGAPELNFLSTAQGNGNQPGEGGYYCGFDKLPSSCHRPSENVVLAGYSAGLTIHSVTKRGTTQMHELKNLRGGVFDAKILPWTTGGRDKDGSYLIAVVIHGPATKQKFHVDKSYDIEGKTGMVGEVQNSPRLLALDQDFDDDDYFQTTVEVYSLPYGQHVETLLALPKRPLVIAIGSPLFDPIPPDGLLSVHADNGHIMVASGVSGEVWLFKHQLAQQTWQFNCFGKIWTTLQHNMTAEPPQTVGQRPKENLLTSRKHSSTPILSHNGRYLAYCPPALSSQMTIGAEISSPSSLRVPGLSSRAPPQLPSVNCQVETPGNESMVKQLLQVGTQKFIEGASYLGGQGIQAWNTYWNKPTSGQSPPDVVTTPVQNPLTPFPPTHGSTATTSTTGKDPGLLSILDLENLLSRSSHSGNTISPLVTFRVPHGCSFVSFAPNGLALFTASSKGDTQFVWDLMRIQYLKSSMLKDASSGTEAHIQHVRQIAQFSRMTIARIVDVVWASPHGERAAMVTEPGTVHILDLPASAFNWPPPFRKNLTPNKKNEEAVDLASNAKSIVSNAGTAVGSVFAATPFGRRRRSTAGNSGMTVAQAGQSTQAFAAGISRSVGAATGRMNDFRKSGTTKLHLPASNKIPAHGCLTLVSGERKDSVMLIASGIVRIYHIRTRRADRPADKQKASKGAKFIEFRLPALPVAQKRPILTAQIEDLQLTEGDLESSYKASSVESQSPKGTESTIPQAELQSNASYQPFHTDYRRVALHVYTNQSLAQSAVAVSSHIAPLHISIAEPKTTPPTISHTKLLAFGLPIATTRVDLGLKQDDDDHMESSRGIPSSVIERITREDGEEILITTRRRKGLHGAAEDESGKAGDDEEWSILDVARQQV